MINFKKPHLVPQSTQSLARGAEADRHRQAKAYDAERANNHRQMDDIRHAQYRKQNTAVNKQKARMSDNAAKASKRITGSSSYYKEGKTFDQFTEFMLEGGRPENPEDAEYLKKNPKPNFSGEKREEKKEKGGALVLRKNDKPEKKKEDDVIDVEVKEVPKLKGAEEGEKEEKKEKEGALDQQKYDQAKTEGEKKREEKAKKQKAAARKKSANKFGRVLGKVKRGVGSTLKTAGRVASYIDRQGQTNVGSPGPGSVRHNVAQYSK